MSKKTRVNAIKVDVEGLISAYHETQKEFALAQSRNRAAKQEVVSNGLDVERFVISSGRYYYVNVDDVSSGFDYKKLFEFVISKISDEQLKKEIQDFKASCKKISRSITVSELSDNETLEVIKGVREGRIKQVA